MDYHRDWQINKPVSLVRLRIGMIEWTSAELAALWMSERIGDATALVAAISIVNRCTCILS